jgi:hypothetical protein
MPYARDRHVVVGRAKREDDEYPGETEVDRGDEAGSEDCE